MAWNTEDDAHLVMILDLLIPPNPDRNVPGAGELGVAAHLAEVAAKSEAFEAALAAILGAAQAIRGEPTAEHVRRLEADQPEAFQALLVETYKGYYGRPEMRAAVGVGKHPVHPDGYPVAREPDDMMAALVAPVRARGPVYRDPTRREDD